MYKISPIQTREKQEKYAIMCGTFYKEGSFGYAMTDEETGELMAMAQFEIEGSRGHIFDLRERVGTEDYEAMFILGRSTMNFIDLCGSHKCIIDKDAADARLIHAIGFRENEDGVLFCDMTGMFDGKCDGHTVKLD